MHYKNFNFQEFYIHNHKFLKWNLIGDLVSGGCNVPAHIRTCSYILGHVATY